MSPSRQTAGPSRRASGRVACPPSQSARASAAPAPWWPRRSPSASGTLILRRQVEDLVAVQARRPPGRDGERGGDRLDDRRSRDRVARLYLVELVDLRVGVVVAPANPSRSLRRR